MNFRTISETRITNSELHPNLLELPYTACGNGVDYVLMQRGRKEGRSMEELSTQPPATGITCISSSCFDGVSMQISTECMLVVTPTFHCYCKSLLYG